jgi:hypothetical protein
MALAPLALPSEPPRSTDLSREGPLAPWRMPHALTRREARSEGAPPDGVATRDAGGRLAALRASADRYAEAAAAERTRPARARDWEAFARWCDELGVGALPADVDTLRCYLAHLIAQGRKTSTLRRARCSIGLRHEEHGPPRPDQTCRTRQVERGIARLHGAREVGATPVLHADLARMVQSLEGSARALRDRAILLLGFAGGFAPASSSRCASKTSPSKKTE